jgi:hypothetical protein
MDNTGYYEARAVDTSDAVQATANVKLVLAFWRHNTRHFITYKGLGVMKLWSYDNGVNVQL